MLVYRYAHIMFVQALLQAFQVTKAEIDTYSARLHALLILDTEGSQERELEERHVRQHGTQACMLLRLEYTRTYTMLHIQEKLVEKQGIFSFL
jgi:hypothetical protein